MNTNMSAMQFYKLPNYIQTNATSIFTPLFVFTLKVPDKHIRKIFTPYAATGIRDLYSYRLFFLNYGDLNLSSFIRNEFNSISDYIRDYRFHLYYIQIHPHLFTIGHKGRPDIFICKDCRKSIQNIPYKRT